MLPIMCNLLFPHSSLYNYIDIIYHQNNIYSCLERVLIFWFNWSLLLSTYCLWLFNLCIGWAAFGIFFYTGNNWESAENNFLIGDKKKIYYRELMLLIILCDFLIIMNICRDQSILCKTYTNWRHKFVLLKTLLWLKEFIITINAQVLLSLECGSCPKGESVKKVNFKACVESFILWESVFVSKTILYCLNGDRNQAKVLFWCSEVSLSWFIQYEYLGHPRAYSAWSLDVKMIAWTMMATTFFFLAPFSLSEERSLLFNL